MPQYPARSLVQPRVWRAVSSPDYEVRSAESGLGFSNEGADGQVNFFLPPAYPGRNYAIFNAEGEAINVVATGGDHISVDQTVATSFNDGGALGSFLQLECPAAPGLWVATGATKAWTGGGGGGGLPQINGTFTDVPVEGLAFPLIAGYSLFQVVISAAVTGVDPNTSQAQLAFYTSPNLDGSNPLSGDTAYIDRQGGPTSGLFVGPNWTQGPQESEFTTLLFNLYAGAADKPCIFMSNGFNLSAVPGDNLDTNVNGGVNSVGLVQSFVFVDSTQSFPDATYSGNYKVQALG